MYISLSTVQQCSQIMRTYYYADQMQGIQIISLILYQGSELCTQLKGLIDWLPPE